MASDEPRPAQWVDAEPGALRAGEWVRVERGGNAHESRALSVDDEGLFDVGGWWVDNRAPWGQQRVLVAAPEPVDGLASNPSAQTTVTSGQVREAPCVYGCGAPKHYEQTCMQAARASAEPVRSQEALLERLDYWAEEAAFREYDDDCVIAIRDAADALSAAPAAPTTDDWSNQSSGQTIGRACDGQDEALDAEALLADVLRHNGISDDCGPDAVLIVRSLRTAGYDVVRRQT